MARVNYTGRLQEICDQCFSSPTGKKSVVIEGYQKLTDLFVLPKINQHLKGQHDLLFQCLSKIFLTSCHRHLDDDQLKVLLEMASNSRLLTMSQNQILDNWYQNIEERTFEDPNQEEEEEDDDDDENWTDESTESDEEIEDKKTNKQKEKKVTFQKKIEQPHQHPNRKTSNLPRLDYTAKPQQSANNHRQVESAKNHQNTPPPLDTKKNRDFRDYQCYLCGEMGHIRRECPTRHQSAKKAKENSPVSTDSPSANNFSQIYNCASTLLNSSQTAEKRRETLKLLCELVRQHENSSRKIFRDKESTFYPLICHIAQNEFLFDENDYSQIYRLRKILLPISHAELNENRSIFARQRRLMPLNEIVEHLKTASQIEQSIFNDFQEYLFRSKAPISIELFDLTKFLLQSTIFVDPICFDNFLVELKKTPFNDVQLEELRTSLEIRRKRFDRSEKKQIWKERLMAMKNSKSPEDLWPWLEEFRQILLDDQNKRNEDEDEPIVDHSMWFFAVLIFASSGHLTKEQYENVFHSALQSSLFNRYQKFYFQVYLDRGQSPITVQELDEIQRKLKKSEVQEKISAYDQLRAILQREKPKFPWTNVEISTIPLIDDHILHRLISLIEIIRSEKEIFSHEKSKDLLDEFLHQSKIVRPFSPADQRRIESFYTEFLTQNELEKIFSSLDNDLTEFLALFKRRLLPRTDEFLDFLTTKLVEIFREKNRFSLEQRRELKSLLEKRIFGKERFRKLNEIYEENRHEINKKISFADLIELIEKNLKEKNQLEQILDLIVLTFDEKIFSIEQTLQLIRSIERHRLLTEKSSKQLLQFLRTLLQANFHSSPKILCNQIENNEHLITQIALILRAPDGKFAPKQWKSDLVDLLNRLRSNSLKTLVQQSPMFQQNFDKEQLKFYWQNSSDREVSNSFDHREMFRLLHSNDPTLNLVAVEQIRSFLLDRKLPAVIKLPKFLEALEFLLNQRKDFSKISLNEWTTLIEENRGKIFTDDFDCDRLLTRILFIRVNTSLSSLDEIYWFLRSRRGQERNDGVKKFLIFLRNTKIQQDKDKEHFIPTIADQIYDILLEITFDERFPDEQVRQCLNAAKTSWLFNEKNREKFLAI